VDSPEQGDQIGRFFTIWAFLRLWAQTFFSKNWSLSVSLEHCWR